MCNNNSFNNNTLNIDDRFGTIGCNSFPTVLRYGNAYVPNQTFKTVFSPAEGLANGTMFPELVNPYYPNQSLAEMNYLRNYNERGCR